MSVGRSVKRGIKYNNCEAIKKNTLKQQKQKDKAERSELFLFFCGY